VNPIFEAALQVQEFCTDEDWEACIIGALAVHRWGEPRLTRDVDLTVITEFGSEERWIEPLLARFEARRPDAMAFAIENRVLLLRADNSVPLDIALGALPFEERIVERSSSFRFAPEVDLRTCSAEDLIVLKAFANREKDWLDVTGIIARQTGKLDVSLVWREIDPLIDLKEEPEIRERLRLMLPSPDDG